MSESDNIISVKDIEKAMKMLEKCKNTPEKLHMGPVMASKIIKQLNDKGITTKGNNGKDYVCGLEVIIDEEMSQDIAYVD